MRSNGVSVYSIKWWRDNDQFYQYIPRNEPPKMPFNVSGIRVDTALSSDVKVILRYVTVETSGAFTCEVMADESFETVRKSKNMTVIDPPDGAVPGTIGPLIEVSGVGLVGQNPLEYHVGKIFEGLCVAKRTYPPAILTWTINGIEAAEDFLTRIHARQENRHLFTTQLWLTFTVSEGIFDKSGRLALVCNASLGSFYHTNTTIVLHNPLLRRSHNSGLFSSGLSPYVSLYVIAASLLFLAITSGTGEGLLSRAETPSGPFYHLSSAIAWTEDLRHIANKGKNTANVRAKLIGMLKCSSTPDLSLSLNNVTFWQVR